MITGPATRAATAGLASLALVLISIALTGAAAAAGAESVVALPDSAPPALPRQAVRPTTASTPVEFDVALQLRDPAGAAALERAVSDPTSASYRRFLTAAQWEARFSPASPPWKRSRAGCARRASASTAYRPIG